MEIDKSITKTLLLSCIGGKLRALERLQKPFNNLSQVEKLNNEYQNLLR